MGIRLIILEGTFNWPHKEDINSTKYQIMLLLMIVGKWTSDFWKLSENLNKLKRNVTSNTRIRIFSLFIFLDDFIHLKWIDITAYWWWHSSLEWMYLWNEVTFAADEWFLLSLVEFGCNLYFSFGFVSSTIE